MLLRSSGLQICGHLGSLRYGGSVMVASRSPSGPVGVASPSVLVVEGEVPVWQVVVHHILDSVHQSGFRSNPRALSILTRDLRSGLCLPQKLSRTLDTGF